jgi:hypothetical protein
MNAIPAEVRDDGQQTQQPGLAVVGGRGRPSKETIEALRHETVTKLTALGVLDQVVEHAGQKGWGKPDRWTTKHCGQALEYARKLAGVTLCKCGQPAQHYLEEEGEDTVALCARCYELHLDFCAHLLPGVPVCDCCGVAAATRFGLGYQRCQDCLMGIDAQVTEGEHGEGPWVDERTLFDILHPLANAWCDPVWIPLELARAWDGFRGITQELEFLRAALTDARKENRELHSELAGAFSDLQRFNDIRRMSEAAGYEATLDQLYIVMSIDNGKAVRDIAHGVQGIIFDAKRRNVVNYKGEVGAKLAITFDKDSRPSECDVAIVTCEVSQKVPAAVCGSRIGLDTSGKVVAPREFFQNLPLGQAGQAGA